MRAIRNVGLYVGHLFTALIGTAIITTGFSKLIHPTSIAAAITKEWLLSITFAWLLGICGYRVSRSRLGMWVWILPAGWFAFGLLMLIPVIRRQSALGLNHGLWYEISGLSCSGGYIEFGCRAFFLHTIPFIRSLAYSSGTLAGMQLWHKSDSPNKSIAPTHSTAPK